MCGKELDMWDLQEDFSFNHHVGYGSKYDCDVIHLALCCDCFDKVMDYIVPQCKISPITSIWEPVEPPHQDNALQGEIRRHDYGLS